MQILAARRNEVSVASAGEFDQERARTLFLCPRCERKGATEERRARSSNTTLPKCDVTEDFLEKVIQLSSTCTKMCTHVPTKSVLILNMYKMYTFEAYFEMAPKARTFL